jgi:hypothetical protein
LLIGQAASLTMGPLTTGHVTPAYAKDRDRGDSGDKNHGVGDAGDAGTGKINNEGHEK